jgi:hypothetical protein
LQKIEIRPITKTATAITVATSKQTLVSQGAKNEMATPAVKSQQKQQSGRAAPICIHKPPFDKILMLL